MRSLIIHYILLKNIYYYTLYKKIQIKVFSKAVALSCWKVLGLCLTIINHATYQSVNQTCPRNLSTYWLYAAKTARKTNYAWLSNLPKKETMVCTWHFRQWYKQRTKNENQQNAAWNVKGHMDKGKSNKKRSIVHTVLGPQVSARSS